MAAPTVTPTASAETFDMPPYVVVLALVVPWAAGAAWMLQRGASLPDALFGGLVATIAVGVGLLLLAPVLVFLVIPALAAVIMAVDVVLVLLRAVATGFLSGLRSASASRRSIHPFDE